LSECRKHRAQFVRRRAYSIARTIFPALFIVCATLLSARAGNIFDDDWTPPAPKATRPSAFTPGPSPPQPAQGPPQPQGERPTPASPAHAETRSPAPVPAKAQQANSRKLFKEVFAAELTDRSAPARRKLAVKLLDAADKSADVRSDLFVLLIAAADAARDAADLELSFRATDALAAAYQVDGLRMRSDMALAVFAARDPAAATEGNCRAVFALCDQLLAVDDYVTATRLLTGLRTLAAAHSVLATQVAKRSQDIEATRAAAERALHVADKLRSAPDDPPTNLVVGQFLCFYKQDWPHGLPMLEKGTDARLKSLAAAELAKPGDAEGVVRVADGWWDAAPSLRDPARHNVLLHAVALYHSALEGTSGLRRAAIEKRIEEVANADRSPFVNLLALVDLDHDVLNGRWRIEQGSLIGDNEGHSRVRIPYAPPEEYDFRIVFTRLDGNADVAQLLSHGPASFAWEMGAFDNTNTLISIIKDPNPTIKRVQSVLANGKSSESIVKVRRNSVSAYLNGKLLASYTTDYSDLSIDGGWSGIDGVLGVGSWQSSTRFDAIELVEITGHGKPSPRSR
jgi:hypothetical protein